MSIGGCSMEFVLRKLEMADAESIAKYANNIKIANNVRNIFPHPYTLEDARAFIDDCRHSEELCQYIRAIVVNQQAVGVIGCTRQTDVHCKCSEIGYWLGEEFWGRGIVTNAVVQISREVFQCQDVARIFAEIFAFSTGSIKVLEKAGFQLEGKLKSSIYKNGVIYDSYIYGLIQH